LLGKWSDYVTTTNLLIISSIKHNSKYRLILFTIDLLRVIGDGVAGLHSP